MRANRTAKLPARKSAVVEALRTKKNTSCSASVNCSRLRSSKVGPALYYLPYSHFNTHYCNATEEVANTLKTLVTFGYRTEAKALQQAMTTFLTAVDATLPLLNTPSPKTPSQLQEDEEKLAQKIREGKLTTEAQLINKLIDPVNIPKIHVEKVDWRVDYI